MARKCSVLREIDSLHSLIRSEGRLNCVVVQGMDLRRADFDWETVEIDGAVFLGCTFPDGISPCALAAKGALVFPRIPEIPYDTYRNKLYSIAELSEGWSSAEDNSLDLRIYNHFIATGKTHPSVLESLARRLHDHSMDDALTDLLEGRIEGDGQKKVVGIMGGHATSRRDPFYAEVVRVAWHLTRRGYFIASGGGPGIMEAANLGAWLAGENEKVIAEVLKILSVAPKYTDEGYVESAREVLARYPNGYSSVAVPTWFYGHEPSNLFSRYIAKYFANSIREDGLLAIATHGVIYAPGSAGTTQEIFMDAAQNHYASLGSISPMAFLGKKRYEQDTSLWATVQELSAGRKYHDMLMLSDSAEEIADFIEATPPKISDEG